MKRDDKILQERLARVAEFQRAGGKLGAVSTSLAQFLLGVGRTRIHELVKAGVLESFGTGGFRLVKLESVLKYARRCARRVALIRRRRASPDKSVQ
jgi:hypothetical protein